MARFSDVWRAYGPGEHGKGGRALEYVNVETGEIKRYGAALTNYRGMDTHSYAKLNADGRSHRLIQDYTKANNGQQGLGLAYRNLLDASPKRARGARETPTQRASRLRALAAFKHAPGQTEDEWLEEMYPGGAEAAS